MKFGMLNAECGMAICAALVLSACADPVPRRVPPRGTAPAIDTAPLGNHLADAQAANLSSAERIKRLRELQAQIAQDAKTIRMFP